VAFLAEVAVFIQLGELAGYPATALVVLLMSLLGLVLLRREGLRAWRRFRRAAAAGQPPGPQVADGLVGLAGALLLAVPGGLTGVAGLVLLVPPVRAAARARVQARATQLMSSAEAGQVFGPRRVRARQGPIDRTEGEIVEGEVVDPHRSAPER
jgi:UPF0716 protein FxsA